MGGKSRLFLSKNDQQEAHNNLAETALSQNDLPTVSKTIDAMNEEQRQSAQSLLSIMNKRVPAKL